MNKFHLLSLFCLLSFSINNYPVIYKTLGLRFRYDYVDIQSAEVLPGFSKLLKNGVRAEYVNPMYPSISYPTWTTLSTGLHPESHNVIGNYFYDPSDKSEFSLFDPNKTGMKKVFYLRIYSWMDIFTLSKTLNFDVIVLVAGWGSKNCYVVSFGVSMIHAAHLFSILIHYECDSGNNNKKLTILPQEYS